MLTRIIKHDSINSKDCNNIKEEKKMKGLKGITYNKRTGKVTLIIGTKTITRVVKNGMFTLDKKVYSLKSFRIIMSIV